MKTSIALIGFMGTGKTIVGRALATRLGREFIELDSLIEQKAGRSIPEIFQEGEIAFRELEIAVTKEISDKKGAVIACGGGIVLNKINIDRLRKECFIVYLTASPGVILKRTSDDNKNERPLLSGSDRARQVKELMRFRQPFYERAADIKIDTSKLNTDAVVEEVIRKLGEYESNR